MQRDGLLLRGFRFNAEPPDLDPAGALNRNQFHVAQVQRVRAVAVAAELVADCLFKFVVAEVVVPPVGESLYD